MGSGLKRKKQLKERSRQKKVLANKIVAARKELVSRILIWDAEELKQEAQVVDSLKDNLEVVKELKEVLGATENGVGIAATQIGKMYSAFITRPDFPKDNKTYTFINPEITNYSDKKMTDQEGCLSYPGYYCDVERSETITIKYTDEKGNKKADEFNGWHARVIQHEYDHLSGRCYIYDYWKSLNKKEVNISTL